MSNMDNRSFQSLYMVSTNENGEVINVFPYTKAALIHFQDNKTLEEKIANIADEHFHDNATVARNGYMSKEDKVILDRINNDSGYTHPVYHPASMIAESDDRMFATKAQKADWTAKADKSIATASSNGLMSKEDKARLDQLWAARSS